VTAPNQPPLHPDLELFAGLLGSWSGRGEGHYPTIESFSYDETITFGHVGKPFLAYSQRTRSTGESPLPLHAETGYWRAPTPGRVELVLAHPTGVTEIEEGTVDVVDGVLVIDLATMSVGLSSSAKRVDALARRFEVRGDTMTYDVSMAAVGEPLTHHLRATLHRVPG
jgi:hypothetical protein